MVTEGCAKGTNTVLPAATCTVVSATAAAAAAATARVTIRATVP